MAARSQLSERRADMNRIVQADCLDEMRRMPDKCIDLLLTDPPYLIATKGGGLAGDRQYLQDISNKHLDQGFDAALLAEFLRLLKQPNIVIFCSRLQIRQYLNWAYDHELNWALLSWHKTNPTPLTNNNYLPDTEYIFHFWNGRRLAGCYHTKRRFYVQPCTRRCFGHPTVKPLNIVSNLIQNASTEGDLILDPFLGSGTTAVAAQQLNRQWIGIEREGEYVEIARARLAALPEPQPNCFGEQQCSTSKLQTTKNSRQPEKKSPPVFATWSSVPFKNSNNEHDSSALL
jgi:site-specific DNA-methyltransferase (adenine-specific)